MTHNIIELRDATGLSQDSFALLCDFSRTTLTNIENGKALPSLTILNKISDFTTIGLEKLAKRDILKYKILNTNFLDTFKERKQIVIFIKEKYDWDINPNTLTTNLKRINNLLIIEPNPNKKIGNVYKKRHI